MSLWIILISLLLNILAACGMNLDSTTPTATFANESIVGTDFLVDNEPISEILSKESIELLSSPLSTTGVVVRIGAEEYLTVESVEKVTLTSVKLDSHGITVEFIPPDPLEKFDCLYLNMSQFYNVPYVNVDVKEDISVSMMDGTQIKFFQTDGGRQNVFLTPNSYIDLNNVDSITLSDGTTLTIPN